MKSINKQQKNSGVNVKLIKEWWSRDFLIIKDIKVSLFFQPGMGDIFPLLRPHMHDGRGRLSEGRLWSCAVCYDAMNLDALPLRGFPVIQHHPVIQYHPVIRYHPGIHDFSAVYSDVSFLFSFFVQFLSVVWRVHTRSSVFLTKCLRSGCGAH